MRRLVKIEVGQEMKQCGRATMSNVQALMTKECTSFQFPMVQRSMNPGMGRGALVKTLNVHEQQLNGPAVRC